MSLSAPHDAPTAGELIEAVVEFLRDPLFGAAPEEHRFHLRVAINVLELVRRELALGPGQARAHGERLRALGVADDGELASRIRAGEVDPATVRQSVLESVVDKLCVANPGYLEDVTP
ncbi:DUF6285 domain-containing protein [Actinophytocola sp.]|uniref:DUF6285 domain-containing protein n=1 Tax=Actinophytocola sp. TaxID=1872138 RepID=UPI003D6C3E81